MDIAVREACEKRFRGKKTLKCKVRSHYPKHLEQYYQTIVSQYYVLLNKTLAGHLPKIRALITNERDSIRLDSTTSMYSEIDSILTQAHVDFTRRAQSFALDAKLLRMADMAQDHKIREWKRMVSQTLGINIFEEYYKVEEYRIQLAQWVDNNVSLITTQPKETISKMRSVIRDGYTNGWSNTRIAAELQERYMMDKRHAKFIARDQMAKLSGQISEMQQTDAGVKIYEWDDAGDSRVRARHEYLNTGTFEWANPPITDLRTGERNHPGEDYQCRCVAQPIFDIETLSLPYEGIVL
jgi:SPP1 gp7 family putative phage head morphogenesis protein